MSRNNPNAAIALAITVVSCFVIGAATTIAVAVPESANPAALIGQTFAFAGLVIAALGALAVAVKLSRDVADIKNGTMEAKIRAAVADVIQPELVREDAHDQLASDRVRAAKGRTQGPSA